MVFNNHALSLMNTCLSCSGRVNIQPLEIIHFISFSANNKRMTIGSTSESRASIDGRKTSLRISHGFLRFVPADVFEIFGGTSCDTHVCCSINLQLQSCLELFMMYEISPVIWLRLTTVRKSQDKNCEQGFTFSVQFLRQ